MDTINDLSMPEPNIDTQFAPADPGFKRSPALLRQLSWLREQPNADYALVQDGAKEGPPVFVLVKDRQLFRNVSLYCSITCGDPKTVGIML